MEALAKLQCGVILSPEFTLPYFYRSVQLDNCDLSDSTLQLKEYESTWWKIPTLGDCDDEEHPDSGRRRSFAGC
jgi:hypothetical protein